MPRVDDWKFGDLLIRVDRSDPASLRLDWLGRSEIGNPNESVAPFFTDLLAEAKEGGCALDLHFEALEYFNSALIATLIHLVKAAFVARVALRIYYDGAQNWQAVSFDVLRRALGSFGGRHEGPSVEFLSLDHGENQQ